jgi:drug/metabolite transporter (DMT)-like permease
MRREEVLGYGTAIIGVVAFGGGQVLARWVLVQTARPLLGATISMIAGSVFLVVLNRTGLRIAFKIHQKSVLFLALAGITDAGGVVCLYMALSREPVIVVTPIISIYPLITILLATIFLQGLERINLRLILGTCLVVAGVILIVVGRNF